MRRKEIQFRGISNNPANSACAAAATIAIDRSRHDPMQAGSTIRPWRQGQGCSQSTIVAGSGSSALARE
jgi:hypothetical protein